MKASEVIFEIQGLLGVKQDSQAVPNGQTDRAWKRLMATAGDAPWPPTRGESFTGEYSAGMRDEYAQLYAGLEPRPKTKYDFGTIDWAAQAEAQVAQIRAHRQRYGKVADLLVQMGAGASDQIWVFIGIIHMMEGGGDFSTHLANGDPLTARTVQEPRGLPTDGTPPFTWEHAALAALKLKKLHQLADWSLPMLLYQFERYNGWGHRKYHPAVLTPYLWSGSNRYYAGKYVRDHEFSPDAVSKQVGAAVLLHTMGYRLP